MLGAFLAGSLTVAIGVPVVSAAGPFVVGTSTAPKAYQHSAQDKVAFLHDGSLLVGYYDPTGPGNGIIKHVTNPSTAPVSTQVDIIPNGSEVTLYTLPGTTSTEIWIVVGSELTGGTHQEQIQHGSYNGSFTWDTLTTIPGSLTSGRQDPTVTWTGKWLIVSWWDDTLGGNTDTVFYNWTTDRTGKTLWHVPAKSGTTSTMLPIKSGTTNAATLVNATTIMYATGGVAPVNGDLFEFGHGTVNSEIRSVTVAGAVSPFTLTVAALNYPHAMGEVDTTAASGVGATSIIYNFASGVAPVTGDMFQIGTAVSNDGTVNCSFPAPPVTYPLCDAEFRQVTVSGSGPYMLTFSALSNAHAVGEPIRIAASLLTPTASNSVQVSMRHSTKLLATIAVYGAVCQIFTRTLLDGASDPSPSNWTTELLVDPGTDDCEGNFGGPQIAIDETTGNIHVFKAVTNSNGPSWSGITYWLGTPDATPMSSGTVSWSSQLIIDATGINATNPPDIAGTVDPSTGKVYVFWATSITGGAIKFVSIASPYTAASAAITVASTGTNPRYPHVPASMPLTGGYVPLVYENGSGPYNIVLDTRYPDISPPSVPTGLTATPTFTHSVNLSWSASTDNVGVTGYTIYRNGSMLTTVLGTPPVTTYSDATVLDATTYTYNVDAFDAAGNHSAQSLPATATTPDTSGTYHPLAPQRVMDTRLTHTPLHAGGSLNLPLGGVSVPSNATAVVLNVTATDTTTAGFFTVYPAGASSVPTASNLNWVAGETVPNLVMVRLGAGGMATIFNGLGSADAVVDLEGYYAPPGGGTDGGFVALSPSRVTDTRTGSGHPNAGMTLGPGGVLNVQISGVGGVPPTGAEAVVLNVTATDTTAPGFLTAYPFGSTRPLASNLNWVAGNTVPNRVIVPLGSGMVSFYNGLGSADLVIDVNGYFTDATASGAVFVGVPPARILDTRNGTGGISGPVGPGATAQLTVAGVGGVPAMGSSTPPKAVVLNVTVTAPTVPSDLVVWPSLLGMPVASDLNFVGGQTVPNLVVVKVGTDGKINIFNAFGSTHVVVDVVGWYG